MTLLFQITAMQKAHAVPLKISTQPAAHKTQNGFYAVPPRARYSSSLHKMPFPLHRKHPQQRTEKPAAKKQAAEIPKTMDSHKLLLYVYDEMR